MVYKFKLILLVILLNLSNLFAQTCETETSLKWILKEAENSDPRILLERLRLEKVIAGKKEAGKIINPELEHFSVWGKEFEPGKVYMNESRLWFTIQLAGKRNKKLSEWASEKDMATFEQEMIRQSLLKDLWMNYFRIHQINEELNLKTSLIEKLEKILNQYHKRKYLSPDQSLEERIFTLVVDNFTLSKSQLERERLTILLFFEEITAFQCQISKIASEADKIKWPTISDLVPLKEIVPMGQKLAELNLNHVKAQKELADAKTYADLRLSPVVQNYKSPDKNNYMYGLSFTLPLPTFDRNITERERNFLNLKYAERKIDLVKLKEKNLFDFKIVKYETGLKILNEVEVLELSLKKFKNLSEAYSEGKLSISNIVEFCRQLDEVMNKYHAGEAILMNDLMELYEQRGTVNTENFEKLI